VARLANYLVVNVSSPNTPGLSEVQRRAMLGSLLDRLLRRLAGYRCWLRFAPDPTSEERRDIAQIALEAGIDGFIISNTTVERPHGILSRHAHEAGGLSDVRCSRRRPRYWPR
jgi:dihydroorotate dehydrogenase